MVHREPVWRIVGRAVALCWALCVVGAVAADELSANDRPGADRVAQKATESCAAAAPCPTAQQRAAAPSGTAADGMALRIAVVEWTIRKGREQDFLHYWSQRSVIPNRSGLISEFMTGPEGHEKWPWINWGASTPRTDATIFYNIGFWRDEASFQEQIGKFIDSNRPPLDFELEKRKRLMLAPLRWRAGESTFPKTDSEATK